METPLAVYEKPDICKACPAYKEPGPVWSSPPLIERPRCIVVGEAPGKQEVEQRKGFVGPAGKLLWVMANHSGLTRHQCYVMNTAKCITKHPLAFRYCWKQFGQNEIANLDQRIPLLALGAEAKHALLPQLDSVKITLARGVRVGRVTVALHPSFIRRTAQAAADNPFADEEDTSGAVIKQDLTPTLGYDINTCLDYAETPERQYHKGIFIPWEE